MGFLQRLDFMRRSKEETIKQERKSLIERQVRGVIVLEDNL